MSSLAVSDPRLVIHRPDEGSFLDFFRQMFFYKEYLKQSVLRDLRKKYKRSALGYLWTMLHPLGMMMVIGTVLSHLMNVPFKEYAVFFLIGVLAWNYFNSTAMMSLTTIRANARLFSQVALPSYIFVISLVASNLVNYLLAQFTLIAVMLVVGHPITLAVLAFPIVILPLVLVTLGVSLILATSNVFYEDTLHLSEVALQALYFLVPVLYARERLPQEFVQWLAINPLFRQIEFLRDIFYFGRLPELAPFMINFASSLLVLLVGIIIFRRGERKFLYFI